MGKFVYVFKRNQQDWDFHRKICRQILMVKESNPHEVSSGDEFLWMNNLNGIVNDNFSLATGVLNFATPISKLEHFSFRLLNQADAVYMDTDVTGSRSVWYYQDDEQFILASSQRIINALIKSFEPNPQAISWMLCTGSLGPGNAWDRRISCIAPNIQLVLKKDSQQLFQHGKNLARVEEGLETLHEEIFGGFSSTDSWGVTLSGGVDSRAVLYQLVKHRIPVQSFTWGTARSLADNRSDAGVARDVAALYGVPFTFMALDALPVQASFLEIFIEQGEGRNDHLNTFIDGLINWRKLARQNIKGIVRADEAFGWIRSETEKEVRISLELNLPEDYENLSILFEESPHLERPQWPVNFTREKNECIEDWRDRLYRNYRIPYILSGLQDPMLNFFEVTNPFLHSGFIGWAIAQPGPARSNKELFNRYSKPLLGSIPYAERPSVPEPEEVLSYPGIKEAIEKELRSDMAVEIFGERLLTQLLNETNPEVQRKTNRLKLIISRMLPFRIKKLLRKTVLPYRLSQGRILLRCYIVVTMRKKILDDIEYAKSIGS